MTTRNDDERMIIDVAIPRATIKTQRDEDNQAEKEIVKASTENKQIVRNVMRAMSDSCRGLGDALLSSATPI